MSRLVRTTAALAVLAAAIVIGAAAANPFPERINFPPNPNTGAAWGAEGIFIQGNTFWAGDTTNGAILKGDIRTGQSSILVPAAAQGAKAAFGVFVDKWNRLWVAGGGAPNANERHAFVYDADTGALIKDIMLATGPFPAGSAYGIINDLTVTKDAAFITNTNNAANPGANVLFKVPLGKHGEIGTPTTIPIPFLGANGIEATPNGKTLIAVSITLSTYWKIDADTGQATQITLDQPGLALRPDGLILRGKTLYSVLNLPNAAAPGLCGGIAEIRLSPDMTTGTVVDVLNDADDPLVNSATADIHGNYIYVIRRNGNFPNAPSPTGCTTTGLTVDRWLTRVEAHGGDS
jgi:hypothetical protein